MVPMGIGPKKDLAHSFLLLFLHRFLSMAFYFALMNVSNKKDRRRSSSRPSHSSSSFYDSSPIFPSAPSNSFESITGSLSQGEGTPNSIVPSSTASFPPPVRTSKKVRFKPQSPSPSAPSSSSTPTRNYFLGQESPSLTTLSASDAIQGVSRPQGRSVLNRFIALIVPSRKAQRGINRSASAERIQCTHRENGIKKENGRSGARSRGTREYDRRMERSMERERGERRETTRRMERRKSDSELDSEGYWAEYDE